MQRTRFDGIVLWAVGLFVSAVLGSTAARADILVNGDFNTGIGTAPGWTITGNVYHVGPGGPEFWFGAGTTAENGPGVIAFNAGDTTPNGSIFQTFATVAGETYTVEYDFGATENGVQQITAEIFGSAILPLATQVASDTNTTATANNLQSFTFFFIADGSEATLRFTDFTGNPTISQDGVLDNVSVVGPAAVPEPGSVALLGIALAGLGFSRRRKRAAN